MLQGLLDVLVSEDELARRRLNWRPPDTPNRGILGIMAGLAASANEGAAWSGPAKIGFRTTSGLVK
jgi:hypothetical protein